MSSMKLKNQHPGRIKFACRICLIPACFLLRSSLVNLQNDKVNSHLLYCLQVLLSFHTAIEFHSVEVIKSAIDKVISVF